MITALLRKILILSLLHTSACASASYRAIQALESGDQCTFCKISQEAASIDPRSQNNLGVCYQNGYCGFEKNQETAVANYKEAARWDIEEAKQNLRNLGIEPPTADLRIAEDQKNRERIENIAKLLVGTLVVAASAVGAAYGAGRAPAGSTNSFVPNVYDSSGCCSWHGGIARGFLGEKVCHWTGNLQCADGAASPTCGCR